jgi:hypothetical protein
MALMVSIGSDPILVLWIRSRNSSRCCLQNHAVVPVRPAALIAGSPVVDSPMLDPYLSLGHTLNLVGRESACVVITRDEHNVALF